MAAEAEFIAALRLIATAPAARGLADDAAVLDIGGTRLVLTMDAIVEGVHFLPDDPPETVAWKLVATNVSDLSAKGAAPRGCLLAYPLAPDSSWNESFLQGLDHACRHFTIPLLGGDTVRQPGGSARSFALVALGEPTPGVVVPARNGAQVGDRLWVSGPLGDAALGLSLLRQERTTDRASEAALVSAYREPRPDPALGVALAPFVTAMMDISDGLLIDAQRLAAASETSAVIELDRLPLSHAFIATVGEGLPERLLAATAGDDYKLFLAAPPEQEQALRATAERCGGVLHPVGRIMAGRGLTLLYNTDPVPMPERLGFEH